MGDNKPLHYLYINELIEANNVINGINSTASNDTKIEVYVNGCWVTLYNDLTLDNDSETRLNLYGIVASKMRITFNNTKLFDNESVYRGAKISEIICYSMNEKVDFTEMVNILDNINNISEANYKTIKNYILNCAGAEQEEIDRYVEYISSFVS